MSTCSWVAYAPRTFRATSPGENSLRVKTRSDTTKSVRSRNATCLRTNRATVSATLPLSAHGVNGRSLTRRGTVRWPLLFLASRAYSDAAHFGMSATEWRGGGAQRWREPHRRKMSKQIRKPGKASARHWPDTPPTRTGEATMGVVVRELATQHVAYMRYVGPYGPRGIPELWMRLRRWMDTRGLEVASTVRLGIAYDDAGITEPAKCSYDACVVVSAGFAADRWVNLNDVTGGRYAVAAFRGTAHQIEGAWHEVFAEWLPDSGYQPDDRACFEIYRGASPAGSKAGAFRDRLRALARTGHAHALGAAAHPADAARASEVARVPIRLIGNAEVRECGGWISPGQRRPIPAMMRHTVRR